MSIYNFQVKDTEQNTISLENYKNNVLLIVNTATGCGFTPQYEGLESLYKDYQAQGLEILDFPSNQFLGQAPGTNEEIAAFCKLNFGTEFKTFSKIDVNGKDADPLFVYLRDQAPSDHENEESNGFVNKVKQFTEAFTGNSIKWNFTKFLVNRKGEVVGRFSPTVKPADLKESIEKLLAE
jgi:glutathione peroxidase